MPDAGRVARLLLTLLVLGSAAGAQALEVLDAEGRLVRLPAPATRIVALAPHIVENLYSIGAGGQLVAAVEYSDYPPRARALPRVGGVGTMSLERIVAAAPDLVLAWGSGTPPALRGALERLGLPLYIDEIRSLQDLHDSLLRLGRLTGREDEARSAAAPLAAVRAADSAAADPLPVFLQVWDEPLQTVGKGHLLNEVLRHCGARSVTERLRGLAPVVSIEEVIAADPALIVAESASQAAHWQDYPTLQAVRGKRVVVVDPDLLHRPTLRLLAGMRTLCDEVAASR